MHPYEVCAGYHSGTDKLGVIYARNAEAAYRMAVAKFGSKPDTDGTECLFIRSSLPDQVVDYDGYRTKSNKDWWVFDKEYGAYCAQIHPEWFQKPKPTSKAKVVPAELVALKRIQRMIQQARRKIQKSGHCTLTHSVANAQASVFSTVEKWVRDEIEAFKRV